MGFTVRFYGDSRSDFYDFIKKADDESFENG